MNEITVSAKTLDDAITEALIQLRITSDMLDYDVVEKGSAGFLGIGTKQAVITARKKEANKANEIKEVKEEKVVQRKVKTKEEIKPKKEEVTQTVEPKQMKKEKIHAESDLAKVEESTKEVCETFLKDVLTAMKMEVTMDSSIDNEGALYFDIKGENMGILIGKRGQTLDSLQYLVNRVANKNQESYVRVKLDTENYRSRRKETLESLAKNIAFKVKRNRRSESLEPMNPYERRIIHSALQSDKAISTYSEGEEPYRKVVITLARKAQ